MFANTTIDSVLDRLSHCLKEDLPGLKAQKRMAPFARISADYTPNPYGAKRSSVIILLMPGSTDIDVAFIRRIRNGSVHGGQLAFPGGKEEVYDKSPTDTALRECNEEIGVLANDIRVLGHLTNLYIPVSNFSVHPVVGYVDYKPQYIPNPDEVEEVHEIGLSQICNPDNRLTKTMNVKGVGMDVPVFQIGQLDIWGATAMILSEFVAVLECADFPPNSHRRETRLQ